MEPATLLPFPPARIVRPRALRAGRLPGSHVNLQAKLNAAADKGYRWGVQDTSMYCVLAFLAGICVSLAVLT